MSAAALAVAGFTTATVLVASDTPPENMMGASSGSEVIARVARDADGREWGALAFTSNSGQPCVAAGRKVGNKVGNVGRDGSFTAYPVEDGGSCVDLDAVPAGAQITRGPDGVTVHGLAGPKVERVTLTADGGSRDLAVGLRGAFLATLDPNTDIERVTVTAVLRDGSLVQLLPGR